MGRALAQDENPYPGPEGPGPEVPGKSAPGVPEIQVPTLKGIGKSPVAVGIGSKETENLNMPMAPRPTFYIYIPLVIGTGAGEPPVEPPELTLAHGYFVVMLLAGAFNQKGLIPTAAGCIGVWLAQGNLDAQTFIFSFYIPAYFIAVFRDGS